MEFKIGDRVNIYGFQGRFETIIKGLVEEVNKEVLLVRTDRVSFQQENIIRINAHKKQCRKLIKKKKDAIWIFTVPLNNATYIQEVYSTEPQPIPGNRAGETIHATKFISNESQYE